jgi:hypothetical protein
MRIIAWILAISWAETQTKIVVASSVSSLHEPAPAMPALPAHVTQKVALTSSPRVSLSHSRSDVFRADSGGGVGVTRTESVMLRHMLPDREGRTDARTESRDATPSMRRKTAVSSLTNDRNSFLTKVTHAPDTKMHSSAAHMFFKRERSTALNGANHSTDRKFNVISDPPRMNDGLAKALFAIATAFLSQSPTDYELLGGRDSFVRAIINGKKLDDIAHLIIAPPLCDLDLVLSETSKAASQILSYISASSFDLIQVPLQDMLAAHKQGGGIFHTAVELSDAENCRIRILERCNWNQKRLLLLIGDTAVALKTLSKKILPPLFLAIYKVIWAWIETNPAEFSGLWRRKRNIGDVDVVFDFLFSNAESKKKKNYWHLMTMLLIVSCEDLTQLHDEGTCLRKHSFLELIRNTLKSKSPDLAVACAIDIVRAAAFVSKEHGTFDTVVCDRLFDPRAGPRDPDDYIEQSVVRDLIAGFARVAPQFTRNTLYPILLDPTSPSSFRSLFAGSCLLSVTRLHLDWDLPVDMHVSTLLRNLFLVHLTYSG